jgi:tetratricopeptide (TPR) repeat protein
MEAIRLLYRSLDLIDRKREPRLVLCALNNLAEDLAFAGRSMEAQRELAKAAPLYQKFSEPMMQARRLWVEALVARSLGHLRKAEELLRQAEAGVAVAGTASDWELISRDMASLNTLPRR